MAAYCKCVVQANIESQTFREAYELYQKLDILDLKV